MVKVKDKIIGIYMIRCKINGKCYIGQSINIKRRWQRHKCDLKNRTHGNKELQEDWNIYGEDKFEFKIIQKCTKDELSDLEKKYIDEYKSYKNGYNKTIGGLFFEGYIMPEDVKEKVRRGENNGFYGRQHTEETKKKMSENHADFSGNKHPKAIMVIGILPSGLILEPMSQIELANLLSIDKHTVVKLRRNGKSYQSQSRKTRHLEGLRILEIPKGNA